MDGGYQSWVKLEEHILQLGDGIQISREMVVKTTYSVGSSFGLVKVSGTGDTVK